MKNTLAARAAAVTRRPDQEHPAGAPAAAAPAADVEPAPVPAPAAPAPAVVPPRARPVQMTVPLSPLAYRQVKAFPDAMNIPEATGKAKIATAELFRALVDELAENDELRKRIADRMIANLAS